VWRPLAIPLPVHVRYQTGESVGTAQPGTLEHFLIERYLLHV
jgi:hypothetical protein